MWAPHKGMPWTIRKLPRNFHLGHRRPPVLVSWQEGDHSVQGESMNLRKSARRLFTVGAIATVTAIAPSTAAFAGIGVSTTGAFLYCNTYNDGALQGGHADCVLTDTSADS